MDEKKNKSNQLLDFSFIQNLPGLFFIKDVNSAYLGASTSFASLLGWKNASIIIGKTDYDIPCDAAEFASQFIQLDKQTVETNQPILTLETLRFAEGWRALLVKREVLFENNNAIGTFSHVIDISETSFYRSCFELNTIDNRILGAIKCPNIYKLSSSNNLPFSLTQRQQECLFLLLRGKTAKQIASILNISPRTVEDHFINLKMVFGCYSKSQLIEKALNLGFLSHIPKSLFSNQLETVISL